MCIVSVPDFMFSLVLTFQVDCLFSTLLFFRLWWHRNSSIVNCSLVASCFKIEQLASAFFWSFSVNIFLFSIFVYFGFLIIKVVLLLHLVLPRWSISCRIVDIIKITTQQYILSWSDITNWQLLTWCLGYGLSLYQNNVK